MELKKNEIRISVPSSLKNLSLIRSLAKAYFEHEKVDEKDAFQLLTIIDELSTNVVEHGYDYNMGDIIIEIKKKDNVIFLAVEDNGVGFDETKISKEEGGLGLKITRRVSDKFVIEKKENGTLFRIEKKLREVL